MNTMKFKNKVLSVVPIFLISGFAVGTTVFAASKLVEDFPEVRSQFNVENISIPSIASSSSETNSLSKSSVSNVISVSSNSSTKNNTTSPVIHSESDIDEEENNELRKNSSFSNSSEIENEDHKSESSEDEDDHNCLWLQSTNKECLFHEKELHQHRRRSRFYQPSS